ncbi:MAG: recombinase family protein [Candidatus Sericytochromatia bacterium]|nr:recombinase family protein [Candidatus Sericytochromatia bacterium]
MSNVIGYIWLAPEQGDDLRAVQADTEAMQAYCRANNLSLQDVHLDKGSLGPALERPVLAELLQRDGVTLVVPSLSALGRRFHDVATVLSEINFRGSQLVAVSEDIDTARPEGQQLLKVFLSIPQVARFMRAAPAEPQKVFVRSREVLHNGGTCPYGYTLDEASNQFRVLQLEANVVRRIFRERIAGRSLRQIANDLTRDGIATKRGGRWQANTVKTILENIFYTGAYQCQNRIYENDHEAIIGEEVFRQVNSGAEVVQVIA